VEAIIKKSNSFLSEQVFLTFWRRSLRNLHLRLALDCLLSVSCPILKLDTGKLVPQKRMLVILQIIPKSNLLFASSLKVSQYKEVDSDH